MRQKHRLRPKTAFSSVIKSANFTRGRAPGRGGAEAAFAGAAERTPGQGCDGEFLKIQNAYLRQAIAEKGVTDAGDLKPLQPELYL